MTKQVSRQPEAAETVDDMQPAGEQSADRPKNNPTTVTKKTNRDTRSEKRDVMDPTAL